MEEKYILSDITHACVPCFRIPRRSCVIAQTFRDGRKERTKARIHSFLPWPFPCSAFKGRDTQQQMRQCYLGRDTGERRIDMQAKEVLGLS